MEKRKLGHRTAWMEKETSPEILWTSRADILIQVIPLVLFQSLVGKFYPARDKFRVRVWGAQAVSVVYLSRFIWIPKKDNTNLYISLINDSVALSSKEGEVSTLHYFKSRQLEKHLHLNINKLLNQRDTHFGRYRVTVIILSFNVTLWKVRPMLSQYWSSSSGRFLDTRPSCKKQNTQPFSLLD